MAWRISKIKFFVTRLNKDAHAKVSSIGTEIKNRYTGLFWKFWNQCHFLLESELYVYKESDMSHKELYLKKQLVIFFKELGYVGGFSLGMKPQINAWNDLLRTACWRKPIWRKKERSSSVSSWYLYHLPSFFYYLQCLWCFNNCYM